jgi:hypothetical protein
MELKQSLFFIFIAFAIFLSGVMAGASLNKPPVVVEESYEIVYERNCYIEFDQRKREIKPLTLEDLKKD